MEITRIHREWTHALAKHPAAAFCPGTNLRFRWEADFLRLSGEPAALPRPKYFLKFHTKSHHICPSIPILARIGARSFGVVDNECLAPVFSGTGLLHRHRSSTPAPVFYTDSFEQPGPSAHYAVHWLFNCATAQRVIRSNSQGHRPW